METAEKFRARTRSAAYGYGLAVVCVGLAFFITQSLRPTLFPTPILIGAVVITTWFAGSWPGLFALVFSTILLYAFFVAPSSALAAHPTDVLLYLAQFVLAAVLSGWFVTKRKEAESSLKQARDQLGCKVQERTAQLQQTNEQLQSEIAERERAQEAFHKTQAELAHLMRVMTMSELATSIAHEVNQPLAAIVTNGDACMRWLRSEPPNLPRARESVTQIISEGNRASEVIKRIRALSKKTLLHKSVWELGEVVHDVLKLLGPELARNQVSLTCELDPTLPPVFGDRIQIQQVILNLVVNSIEAMQATGHRELSIKSQCSEPGQVMFSIRDSGVGLDERQFEQIFEAFYTTKREGVGMGLSISRTIIETHGGRLWATSHNGPGATLQFTLPAAETAS